MPKRKWRIIHNVKANVNEIGCRARTDFYSGHHLFPLASSFTFHSNSSIPAVASSRVSCPLTVRNRSHTKKSPLKVLNVADTLQMAPCGQRLLVSTLCQPHRHLECFIITNNEQMVTDLFFYISRNWVWVYLKTLFWVRFTVFSLHEANSWFLVLEAKKLCT